MNCAFCGKGNREVKHMVQGPGPDVLICDECVGQSLIILASQGWVPPTINIKIKIKLGKDVAPAPDARRCTCVHLPAGAQHDTHCPATVVLP